MRKLVAETDTKSEVSVIVCIYNGEKTLPLCIKSLLGQTYPCDSFEIIFVNDGSKDGSAKICLQFLRECSGKGPKLTYVHQENAGLSRARNTGICLAKGQFIAFIDQDAVAESNWLENLVIEFGTDDTVGVVGGRIQVLNNQSRFANLICRIHYRPPPEVIRIIGTNMAYRRDVFEQVKGFFEIFDHRGDETAFLSKVLPHFKSKMALGAVVYHEHPDNLKKWLGERSDNGKFFLWVKQIKHFGGEPPKLHTQVKRIIGCLGWFAVPLLLLCFSGFRGFCPLVLFCVALLAVNYYLRGYHSGLRYLAQDYSTQLWWMMPFAVVVQLLGMIAEDIGFFWEMSKRRNIDLADSLDNAAARITQVIRSDDLSGFSNRV